MERTLSIIKPDAVRQKQTGKILNLFEENEFRIIALKKLRLSQKEAENFYHVHRARPFFGSLVQFMISGPVLVQVIEKENAIEDNRKLMGTTNPSEAKEGTIRKLYGTSIESNAVHGSDSKESAEEEITFFFSQKELL